MKNFAYERANSPNAAVQAIAQSANAKFLGGGTNLVDLMRENIEQPDKVIDVTHLSTEIEETESGIRIGAAVNNTSLANHPLIRQKYPFLSQAILFGASGQIRNMATVAGNIMQRTRCHYFYDEAARCNKHKPGSGCDALEGFNRIHAIMGASDACIATHPSDMCVALAALDSRVMAVGKSGQRTLNFTDFHRLPGDTPHVETELKPDELIIAIEIPNQKIAVNSLYRKVRDRASYAFALVSVAAALEVENNTVKQVRIALGGVAHKPWRAFTGENLLIGSSATEAQFQQAAEAELGHAKGYKYNTFKIGLAKRTIVSVLLELTQRGAKQWAG
jgi:xanthine dehydrogenase YagS FAD-binding subunit